MQNLSPEVVQGLLDNALKSQKPHLLEIEKQLHDAMGGTGYGSMEVQMEFRANNVIKMTFKKGATWLKDKSAWL